MVEVQTLRVRQRSPTGMLFLGTSAGCTLGCIADLRGPKSVLLLPTLPFSTAVHTGEA